MRSGLALGSCIEAAGHLLARCFCTGGLVETPLATGEIECIGVILSYGDEVGRTGEQSGMG